MAFAQRLIALRRDNPVLRQGHYLHGRARQDGAPDVAWSSLEGGTLNWRDASLDGFCLLIRGGAETSLPEDGTVLIVVNGGQDDLRVMLPDPGNDLEWERVLDTAAQNAPTTRVQGRNRPQISAHSLVMFTGARVAP